MNMRALRIWLWAAVAALVLTAGAGALLLRPPPTAQSSFGVAEFDLVDHHGRAVDQSLFVGHPSMLFFGFTHCPDVCPTTLAEMGAWLEALGAEGDDLRGYFVSIDPERDSPAILEDYVGWVDERVTGLTGAPDQIANIARAWGVFYEKVPLDDGNYTMDHTASVFLLDRAGAFQSTIAFGEDTATALSKLRNLLAKS